MVPRMRDVHQEVRHLTQLSFDDLSRGTKARPRCRWCKRISTTGEVVDDSMVILGRCLLMGDIAYDRRCETCASWEGAE